MRRHLGYSGVGDVQISIRVLLFAQDPYFREFLVMMEPVSAYSVAASSVAWLVYLSLSSAVVGQILMEPVCLRFWEGKLARIRRRLNDSGVDLVSAYSVTAAVGQVLIEPVCLLRFWEGKLARIRRRLNDSGVVDLQLRLRILMFAQGQCFRELLVMMELASAYSLTGSSVG